MDNKKEIRSKKNTQGRQLKKRFAGETLIRRIYKKNAYFKRIFCVLLVVSVV